MESIYPARTEGPGAPRCRSSSSCAGCRLRERLRSCSAGLSVPEKAGNDSGGLSRAKQLGNVGGSRGCAEKASSVTREGARVVPSSPGLSANRALRVPRFPFCRGVFGRLNRKSWEVFPQGGSVPLDEFSSGGRMVLIMF